MRNGERRALGRAPHLQHHHGDIKRIGKLEPRHESGRIANGLQEQPDHSRRLHAQGEIEVIGRGGYQFLAGRNRKAVGKAPIVVREAREDRP